jgi:hypothetical protein
MSKGLGTDLAAETGWPPFRNVTLFATHQHGHYPARAAHIDILRVAFATDGTW